MMLERWHQHEPRTTGLPTDLSYQTPRPSNKKRIVLPRHRQNTSLNRKQHLSHLWVLNKQSDSQPQSCPRLVRGTPSSCWKTTAPACSLLSQCPIPPHLVKPTPPSKDLFMLQHARGLCRRNNYTYYIVGTGILAGFPVASFKRTPNPGVGSNVKWVLTPLIVIINTHVFQKIQIKCDLIFVQDDPQN